MLKGLGTYHQKSLEKARNKYTGEKESKENNTSGVTSTTS